MKNRYFKKGRLHLRHFIPKQTDQALAPNEADIPEKQGK